MNIVILGYWGASRTTWILSCYLQHKSFPTPICLWILKALDHHTNGLHSGVWWKAPPITWRGGDSRGFRAETVDSERTQRFRGLPRQLYLHSHTWLEPRHLGLSVVERVQAAPGTREDMGLTLLWLLLCAATNAEKLCLRPQALPLLCSRTLLCEGGADSLSRSEETVDFFPRPDENKVKLEFDELFRNPPSLRIMCGGLDP